MTIGDLVEDVAVHHAGSIRVGSDTAARIERRRGGSAANTAAAATRAGHAARFVGRVGDDAIGAALVAELAADGVDVSFVQREGRTGTIVVLVDPAGERTMLPDRGACLDLAPSHEAWLDGVSVLHVPLYSFTDEPLRTTSAQVVDLAHRRGVVVSLDVSSTAIIDAWGLAAVREFVTRLRPAVIFANSDEASALGIGGSLAGALTIVKRGPEPVEVHDGASSFAVDVPPVAGVADTTGAGDAFAAGVLNALTEGPEAAVRAGNTVAAALLVSRTVESGQ